MRCGLKWLTPAKLPDSLPKGSISHGICKKCLPAYEAEVDRAIARLKENQTNEKGTNVQGMGYQKKEVD